MTEVWTPLKLIAWTQGYFARAGVDAPRLTAELLLAEALSCDRVRLYLDFDKPLGPAELATFRALVMRRAEGEPTAYLLGRRDFFGRTFRCDARALVPRPETELLVEAALSALPEGGALLDLCTGTGCVAVSVALARPGVRVVATDRSPEALALAGENAAALGAAGAGLDLLRRIVAGAPERLLPGGTLALEMHESHRELLPRLCEEAGLVSPEVRKDLAGLPRLVLARARA